MISQEERIKFIESVRQSINMILQVKLEELIREEDLGKVLSFKPAEEYFVQILEIVTALGRCDISKIPHRRLESLNNELGEMLQLIGLIKQYKPNTSGGHSRDNILDKAEIVCTSMYANIVPILSYLKNDATLMESQAKEVKEILDSVKFMQNDILAKKSKVFNEAEEILKNLKDTASESGVTKYSEIFANEANENNKKATHWLIAVIFFGFVSIGVAYFFLTIKPEINNPTNYEIVHFALTKIIVFTILYYLLLLFVKNYNAQRHNYIINKHRQNALTTFGTFVSSTKDIDTKNAVLLQTTHSIFATQNSGYLKNETDIEPSQKLIEIIRASNKQ